MNSSRGLELIAGSRKRPSKTMRMDRRRQKKQKRDYRRLSLIRPEESTSGGNDPEMPTLMHSPQSIVAEEFMDLMRY
ncbi:hypothetical protein JTE90_024451 [Oedothorax gibbosus]|uniref:Uncharacterized protein n=1 Tax=Oedothorax gibbosus TaxID=931172 RepID=A0AAV6UA09_9ARAC|nr:hypothetical protein JTE90_024451 [Oedothorax gibbosus]